jgi:hypothetical protein
MDLKGHLRQAISWYGLEAVHTTFQEICKEDYDFLRKLYDVPHKVLKAPTPPAPVQESPVEEEIPRPEKLRDTKVRVVKKPASEDLANEPFTQTTNTTNTTNTTSTLPAPQVLTSSVVSTHTPHTESGLTDPKDIKKWQKEQEDKKKRELDAQGINPASLLTKENLQKWIVEEKKTFAAVARDYVGLPDSMIASAAKSYGIQSETSKRRAIIAASKRK